VNAKYLDHLTVGQVWVLNYIEDYRAARGAMPSVATIALATGLGESTVRMALERLAAVGYLPDTAGWAA
jgi:DNA-binding IclR family transcriptional regulator